MSRSSQSQELKKVIIFDFDGVLADSFDTFYPLLRDAMNHAGLSLTPDQYRDFFIGNVHQGFKNFISDEEKYSVFIKFRSTNYDKYYYNKKRRARLFPGTSGFIKKLSKNYILTVASSGKKDNIQKLLKANGIDNFFSLILADFAYSKEGMINEILDEFLAKPEETFLITDTVGDIKVAKKLGLKTIAVTWGFHFLKLLKTAQPDYIANNFQKLQNILKI